MSRHVVAVPPTASLFDVFERMTEAHVHHVPVVRTDGRVLALLDYASVIKRLPSALVTMGATPLLLPGARGALSVLSDMTVVEAAHAMTLAGVDGVCVVDEGGHLLGILTATDVVRVVGELIRPPIVLDEPVDEDPAIGVTVGMVRAVIPC